MEIDKIHHGAHDQLNKEQQSTFTDTLKHLLLLEPDQIMGITDTLEKLVLIQDPDDLNAAIGRLSDSVGGQKNSL